MFFKEFDYRFQNTYFTERLSVAASKIHKFLTSFTKLVLFWKVMLELPTNLHKICSKLTINALVSILLALYTFHNFSSFFIILYWQITLLLSSFTMNLNSFYVKIGERITKTKLLPFSRQLSGLKLFFQEKLWIKGFICCTNVKIKF